MGFESPLLLHIPKCQPYFLSAYEIIKEYLVEATPIEKVKIFRHRPGVEHPTRHARKSRQTRSETSEGIRWLRTLMPDTQFMNLMNAPAVLEWGECP